MVTKTMDDSERIMLADSVKPDSRKRIVLPKKAVREGVTYRVFQGSRGQIILEPMVYTHAYEAWLLDNKELMALLDKSMFESTKGQVVKRGSFAKQVKDEA